MVKRAYAEGYKAGQEAMRERAGALVDKWHSSLKSVRQPINHYGAETIASDIRDLPIQEEA
jgi:flagellar biosynthesis/type III secretory pathway protein FliH